MSRHHIFAMSSEPLLDAMDNDDTASLERAIGIAVVDSCLGTVGQADISIQAAAASQIQYFIEVDDESLLIFACSNGRLLSLAELDDEGLCHGLEMLATEQKRRGGAG